MITGINPSDFTSAAAAGPLLRADCLLLTRAGSAMTLGVGCVNRYGWWEDAQTEMQLLGIHGIQSTQFTTTLTRYVAAMPIVVASVHLWL